MTLEEAMKKVAKLLRLSESSNPHEAALAAQRAQEILTRYSIDKAALNLDNDSEPDEVVENFTHRSPLDSGKQRITRWKALLSVHVAKANQCRVYTHGNLIGIVGRASDVEKVRYLYDMLVVEIDRLAERDGKGCGKHWRLEYRQGVVSAIADKLKETHAKVASDMRAENSGTALVRVNQAIARLESKDRDVDAWMAQNMNLRSVKYKVNANMSAREAGYKAGKSINLAARGALPSGTKRLK